MRVLGGVLCALLFSGALFGQLPSGAVSVYDIKDGAGDSIMDAANDAMKVNCVTGCAGSGASHVDDAAFAPGTDDIAPAGAMFDDDTPDTVNEGDAGIVRMSANRNLYTTIRDAAGNERGVNVTATNQLEVNAALAAGTNNIGDVDVLSFPDNEPFNLAQVGGAAVALGQAAMAASLPFVPANNITDATYIGDIKFGEELPAGTNNIGDVDVLSFPDNEPFNLAQYGGSAVGATNAVHVQPGTGATFTVTDGSGNMTVDGTVAATQSGTWTVQPGNTANTTPWLVEYVPLNGCAGTTLQDITQVNVAITAGSALTSADTCVFSIFVTNKTASEVTLALRDKQGTPVSYVDTLAIPPRATVRWDFDGMKFVSGVQAIAGTASALNARLIGVQ